ncbi:MAG: hypothetical protein KDC36_13020 [Thermoleophilia bacterium]|nr:hypothetical protein [Thermoleophilia bacterium]
MPLRPRRFGVPLIVGALALAVAGCGGGGGGNDTDATKGLSATQILDRSVQAAGELNAFTIAVEGTATPVLAPSASQQSLIPLSGPIEIGAQGPVVRPDQLSLDATITPGSFPIQANVTRVAGKVFVSALGRSYRLGLPEAQVARIDASQVFPLLRGWIADPKIDGEDTVGGQKAVRITGTVDADAAAADVVSVMRTLGVSGDAASADAVAKRIAPQLTDGDTVTVWVRTNDFNPARFDTTIGIKDATAINPALESLDADLSITLSDFNADLSVQEPTGAQELTLNDIGQLLGGLGG